VTAWIVFICVTSYLRPGNKRSNWVQKLVPTSGSTKGSGSTDDVGEPEKSAPISIRCSSYCRLTPRHIRVQKTL